MSKESSDDREPPFAFDVLEELGIEYLFGVEGTTELPLIDGAAAYPGVTYVQALHAA